MPEFSERKRNIFDIDAELDQVALAFDTLEEGGTEEEIKAAVENYFGDLLDERDAKLDRYAKFIANKEAIAKVRRAEADAVQAEADRLKALAKTDENAAKSAKAFLKLLFDHKGITKLETTYHKFSIQKNGGVPPLEIDPNANPSDHSEFVKVAIDWDKDAIREALEKGQALNFASFGERGTRLVVK